jgi:hypothetical protein
MKLSLLLHILVIEILGVLAGVDLNPIHLFMCVHGLQSSPSIILTPPQDANETTCFRTGSAGSGN